MAKKEDIKEWLSKNGLTKKEVNQMWDECCEVSSKCRMIRDAGKSWKNLPMNQIEKIPTLKEKTLRNLREKDTHATTSVSEQAESSVQELSESEKLLQKIINKERLSEREIRSLLWDYGTGVDELEGDIGRWTQSVSTIVKLCDQYVRIDWDRGLTELQENHYNEQPYLVEKRERVVTQVVVDWLEKDQEEESKSQLPDESEEDFER